MILFLEETKCSSEDLMAYNKRFWKGAETITLHATDVVQGLGILWNPNLLNVSNFLASRNTLPANFHVMGTSVRGVIMNVYNPFQLAHKPSFLEEIRTMGERVEQGHWILGGDFNIIRSLEEKKGGIKP